MFTGIIERPGTTVRISDSEITLRADRAFVRKLKIGGSVAVNGVCLTVREKSVASFTADIMPETARRTTFGAFGRGQEVNLELPTTPSSFLSGHLVQGHAEGVGTITEIAMSGNSRIVSVSLPPPLADFVAQKGSIALDGVSLTVSGVKGRTCTVGIIPFTWENTALRTIRRGGKVNVETDVLAKYVKRLLERDAV